MDLPNRKPTRLKNFDYSKPRGYFITMCTQDKRCILSSITNDNVVNLKPVGKVVNKYLIAMGTRYSQIKVHKFVIMPNHIHLLLLVYGNSYDGKSETHSCRENIVDAIGWFKYKVTKEINQCNGVYYKKIFQRSFHDHIIRGERDYEKIWYYINSNPKLWKNDCFYHDSVEDEMSV